MRRATFLFAVLLLPALGGCAYLRGLGKDAAETLQVGVGGSLVPGVLAWAYVPVVGGVVGWAEGAWVGTDYGATGRWDQAGWGLVAMGELARTRPGGSLDGWWRGDGQDAYFQQSQFLLLDVAVVDRRTASANRPIVFNKVEVGVHALFVGVTIGLDLFELGDLVAGLFGWDLLGDDDFVPDLVGPSDAPAPPVDDEAATLRGDLEVPLDDDSAPDDDEGRWPKTP